METSIQFFVILLLLSLCIPAYATAAPVLLPVGDKTATEGSSLIFTVVATDGDNKILSYSASNLPQGARFSPLSTQEIFSPYSSMTYVFPFQMENRAPKSALPLR